MDYDSWAVTDATDQGSPRRSPGGGDDIGTPPSDDLPACQSCRKRKSKCSREIPSCSQCIRLSMLPRIEAPCAALLRCLQPQGHAAAEYHR